MVSHSVPAGEEGAEGTMPSPHRARVAKPGRGEGRTESRSIWGSHPLHPVWKCLLPGVTHPHHRPAPMSRCHSALDLTPCWHRCLQITRSVPPVPGSAWNKPPRCVCFAFQAFSTCLYRVNQLLAPPQSAHSQEGSCSSHSGVFPPFYFPRDRHKGRGEGRGRLT